MPDEGYMVLRCENGIIMSKHLRSYIQHLAVGEVNTYRLLFYFKYNTLIFGYLQ